MLNEYLIAIILELLGMPAEIAAGILALYRQGLLSLCMSVLAVCITMVCIGIRRSFIEQSGMAVRLEPLIVVTSGLVLYGISIALMLVFTLSIVGFPIAALAFFVMSIFIFIGHAALSVMLGEFFVDKLNKTMNFYQSAFFGAVSVEIFKYIPYNIGWLYQYFILPVFALGAVAAGISNGYLRKKFYAVTPERKPDSKRREIREMLLKHVKDTETSKLKLQEKNQKN